MKIEQCKHRQNCDFVGCKNVAQHAFRTKGILRKQVVFCEECMQKMHQLLSKFFVPKSVKAPFKQKIKKEKL